MKNHWLDKKIEASQFIKDLEGEAKMENLPMGDGLVKDRGNLGCDFCKCDFTQDEGWTEGEMLFFINKMGEQKLAAWLIRKYKDDPEWLNKVFVDGLIPGIRFPPNDKPGFPADDEHSKQAGCCGDFACNCTANLDVFYNTQFCQGETVKEWSKQEKNIKYVPTEYTPIVVGTMDGKVFVCETLVQTFCMDVNGVFNFTKVVDGNWITIVSATCNFNTGEIEAEWSNVPAVETKLVVNYEFNYEPPKDLPGWKDGKIVDMDEWKGKCEKCGEYQWPMNDEHSMMQGDPMCACSGSGNLDIFYSSRFVQNETLQSYSDHFITTYIPVLAGTMTGEIHLGQKLIQAFTVDGHGVFHFEKKCDSDFYVNHGSLNLVTGEVYLTWNAGLTYNYGCQILEVCDEVVKVVVNYEFNMEK